MIKLSRSYGNVTKTGFTRSSRQVYFCDLDAGQYMIEIQAGSSLGHLDQIITNTFEHMVSIPTASLQQYSIQLRKSLSKRQRVLLLPMVFIGLFLFNIGLFTILSHAFGIQLEGANYWINRPPILVRTVPVILIPNVPFQLKKDSRLAE